MELDTELFISSLEERIKDLEKEMENIFKEQDRLECKVKLNREILGFYKTELNKAFQIIKNHHTREQVNFDKALDKLLAYKPKINKTKNYD
jgi:hypothetical protein